MKTGWNAASSDLDRARTLSRSLRPGASLARRTESTGFPGGFVRFRFAGQELAQPRLAAEPAAPQELPDLPAELSGGALWDRLLELCATMTKAETAFIMDGFGLLVSCRGPLAGDEFEEIGARLILILEQARQMRSAEPAGEAVAIEMGEKYLSGFQVLFEDGLSLTIGLIGKDSVTRNQRVVIARAIGKAMGVPALGS